MTPATRRTRSVAADPDDATILTRVAQGDLGALGMLYDRYASQLVRFARRKQPVDRSLSILELALRVIDRAVLADVTLGPLATLDTRGLVTH